MINDKIESVKIGKQVWMAKNLIADSYRNGEIIKCLADKDWADEAISAYTNINSDPSMDNIFGKLYNWHAVKDPRGLAPFGWHVPSLIEWKKLIKYLGGTSVAGGKLKEAGTAHWNLPNLNATNSSGFKAVPAGWYWNKYSEFEYLKESNLLWTADDIDNNEAWIIGMSFEHSNCFELTTNKNNYLSVRCLRD